MTTKAVRYQMHISDASGNLKHVYGVPAAKVLSADDRRRTIEDYEATLDPGETCEIIMIDVGK